MGNVNKTKERNGHYKIVLQVLTIKLKCQPNMPICIDNVQINREFRICL